MVVKKLILVILSFWLTSSLFAEMITLKSGKTVEAVIIEKTDEYIKVDIGGIPITYYLDEISYIENGKQKDYRKAISYDEAKEISLKKLKRYSLSSPNITDMPNAHIRNFVSDLKAYAGSGIIIKNDSKINSIYDEINNIALRYGMQSKEDPEFPKNLNITLNIKDYLAPYGLSLNLGVIKDEEQKSFHIWLSKIKSSEIKKLRVALLQTDVQFNFIVLEEFYIETYPMTASFVETLVTQSTEQTIASLGDIVFTNFEKHYANALDHFLFFDTYKMRGIDIHTKKYLSDNDIFFVEEDDYLPRHRLLYIKMLYKAWRDLYLESVSKFDKEKQQIDHFAKKYVDIQLALESLHEATHLAQNIGNFMTKDQPLMKEYEAYANTLIQSEHPYIALFNIVAIASLMQPNYNSEAAAVLLVHFSQDYSELLNKPKPTYSSPEQFANELFSSLEGIDQLSNDDIKRIINTMKKSSLSKYQL